MYYLLFFVLILGLTSGNAVRRKRAPISDLRFFACKRNPSLRFCSPKREQVVFATSAPPTEFTRTTLSYLQSLACQRNPKLTFCPSAKSTISIQTDARNLRRKTKSIVSTEVRDYCINYKKHYNYYCFNITSHKFENEDDLVEYCQTYDKNCNENGELESFPGIEIAEPCVRGCTAPHCTPKCICEYYAEQIAQDCLKVRAILPFRNNCHLWWSNCKDYYNDLYQQPNTRAESNRFLIEENKVEAPFWQWLTRGDRAAAQEAADQNWATFYGYEQ